MEAVGVVKRAVGFAVAFEFTAEVTVKTADGGYAVVREGGHTEMGAMKRAEAAARMKMTARRWACGFTADGYRDETRNAATFAFGFAA